MAKVDWTYGEVVKPDDLNDIGREINDKETPTGAQQKVDAHANLKDNPHNTTAEQVGLGNVTNIRQASKAEFDSHADNIGNPHQTTATQVGAYTKQEADNKYETTSGAQSKATAAETAAINWAKSFGVGDVAKDIRDTDLNLLDLSGFYRGQNLGNAPEGSNWYYIIHIKHANTYKTQIAIRTSISSTRIHHRNLNNGKWSKWTSLNNNYRTKLSSAFDILTLEAGQYYAGGSAITNGPLTNDSSWFNIDVTETEESAALSEKMKQFVVTRNYDGRMFKGFVHSDGAFKGWKEIETVDGTQSKVNAHEQKNDNPHNTTKNQVGLGNVPNYGAASQAEAEAGSSNSVLMTAQRTKQAIDKFAQTPPLTLTNGTPKISLSNSSQSLLPTLIDLGVGMHTFYAHSNVPDIPDTLRGFIHLTGVNPAYGYVWATDHRNNLFTNYVNNNVWTGWRKLNNSSYVVATTPSTGTRQALTKGANNKLNFSRELCDSGNDYNVSNMRYTARYDGLYLFNASAFFESPYVYQNFELKLYVNDSEKAVIGNVRNRAETPSTTYNFEQIVSGSVVLNLKAGDYVELYVYVGQTSQWDEFALRYHDSRFNYFIVTELGGKDYDSFF
ncbi:C1q-like domain-containing protein [Cytobacillus purgationiresistens]|uniref:C1q domain-containing protein n=1 Tax=Cytobacillus purgationiresistens TaxID=863449 RepID=A0ABU0AFX6_9BACI|nr:hypothetical protein [Cytobacillus purgationiresistens]MDQ0269925.1 hypothetical protein [Cytobacillus purgationiresistens]